ncbi:MAG: precorrin-8X methylmutase, partial [Oscillospiraceae bacterium]
MKIQTDTVLPEEIEKRSFEIITSELGERKIAPENEAVVKRVIHTSADFDYYDNLVFSQDAVQIGLEALKNGARIVTDTNMAFSGVSKAALKQLGCELSCFMADEAVAVRAKQNGTTRAV